MRNKYVRNFSDKTELVVITESQLTSIPLWIISYDIGVLSRAKKKFNDISDIYQSTAKLSNSCYVIETEDSEKNIHSKMSDYIDGWDALSISPFTTPFYGNCVSETLSFLKKRFSVQT